MLHPTRNLGCIVALALVHALAAVALGAAHSFTFTPPDDMDPPHSVAVAGTFNGWSRDAHPMQRDDHGAWHATLDLPDGVHHYKFVVNGETWINDPASDRDFEEPDGLGGINSAVYIGVDGRTLPPPQPAHIRSDAVLHDPARDMQRVSGDLVYLTLRTQAGDVTAATALIVPADGDGYAVPMTRAATHLGFDEFAAMVRVSGPASYLFELTDGPQQHRAESAGADWLIPAQPAFPTPDWAKHAVWYQIFPERFRNGDPRNDPDNSLPWTSDWWATHTAHGETPGEENFYRGTGNVWWRKYGGDVQGLIEALPYLRRLGVNALYLNPVFEAESQHKYDTADFRHIDDNFGVAGELEALAASGVETDDPATWTWTQTDLLFLRFVAEAHRQGFHVIIDGVFNHTGRPHFAFQDVLKHGRESRYADWFDITDWGDPDNWGKPDTYGKPGGIQWKAWDGDNGWLPCFKKDADRGLADGPREHIFAITRRWQNPRAHNLPPEFLAEMEATYGPHANLAIDGWRLDVPGDIPHPFWIEWRQLVKSLNPEAYISGEIWSFAHPWLQGDQFDAVMNYQFAIPAQQFFVNQRDALSPVQFAQRMHRVVYGYPLAASLVNQNLYDSHDTDRLASMFVNPDRPYDGANRPQDNGPDYSPRKPDSTQWRRMRQAVALQLTFLGAPMVYYGTEAGMWSPDDPSNRQPMVWPGMTFDDPNVKFDPDLYAWFQRLITIRHALPALRLGLYRTVMADDSGLLVFARDLGQDRVYVAINRSPEGRTALVPVEDDGAAYYDLMNPAAVSLIDATADGVSRLALEIKPGAPRLGQNRRGVVLRLDPWDVAILTTKYALQ